MIKILTKNKKINKYPTAQIQEFVRESNAIEDVFSKTALEDGIAALYQAVSLLSRGNIDPKKILKIHETLMSRIDPSLAGIYRLYNVRIGYKICPDWKHVMGMLKTLCARPMPTTEEDIRSWHIEFERIHPFGDGNGRTGRCILCAQRILAGLPIEVIKADERHEYYKWFNE